MRVWRAGDLFRGRCATSTHEDVFRKACQVPTHDVRPRQPRSVPVGAGRPVASEAAVLEALSSLKGSKESHTNGRVPEHVTVYQGFSQLRMT